jgi:glycosyltransferase involved in cell wall biosynthesis
VKILTNFLGAPAFFDVPGGSRAHVIRAGPRAEFRRHLGEADLVIINCGDSLIYEIAARFLLFPWKRRPVACVDIILRKPRNLRERLLANFKRLLLSRIDCFIHYFKDISGYTRHFGISAARSSYVPFKSNFWGSKLPDCTTEDYIFTVGVSMRDYDTFIRAVAGLPYTAAITEFALLHFEGRTSNFRWSRENVPRNLKILPDSGRREDLLRLLAGARVVVVPTQASSLCASGISTYLDAMYLGKCVIATAGPGTSDVLTDQAVLVPPHDVLALQNAIRRVWDDDHFRHRTAASGRRYAHSLGGDRQLIERVFAECLLRFDRLKRLPGQTDRRARQHR